MSVLIKGMEMPENCRDCEFWCMCRNPHRMYCKSINRQLEADEENEIGKKRLSDCSLIEVPAPHGDLIDRDALNIGEYEREDDDSGTLEISLGGLLSLYHKVIDAPTVIEAEETE